MYIKLFFKSKNIFRGVFNVCLLLFISLQTQGQNVADTEKYQAVRPKYGFIENKGQVKTQQNQKNVEAKYILPLPNNNVVLRNNGFSYDTYIGEEKKDGGRVTPVTDKTRADSVYTSFKFHRIDVEFEGGNPYAEIIAEERSQEHINYFIDNQKIQVYHYSKILYKGIYPGIDVEFTARSGKGGKPVEYNFIIHPGADIGQIKLRYRGAIENELSDNTLSLKLDHGKVTETIPASYWQISKVDADVRYKQIACSDGGFMVGFEGQYLNRNNESLVVDPTPYLEWSKYYGGDGLERVAQIKGDASGNIFVAGTTFSAAMIATTGAQQTSYGGGADGYILKYDSNGGLEWATYYGGTRDDVIEGIAIDVTGNICIAGYTNSPENIATNSSYQSNIALNASGNGTAGFVAKFNSSGRIVWGTYYGYRTAPDSGGWGAWLSALSVDLSGNIVATGGVAWNFQMVSSDFATPNSHQPTHGFVPNSSQESLDAIVVKFSPEGDRLWGTFYGGRLNEEPSTVRVAVDNSGNIYMLGCTKSIDEGAIATPNGYQTSNGGVQDWYLVKFNSGGVRQWGTYYGGPSLDISGGIAVDNSSVYVSGSIGGNNVIIAKFNVNGEKSWTKDLQTYFSGTFRGISIDAVGNVYFAARANGSSACGGTNCSHIVKLTGTGDVEWDKYYGNDYITDAKAVFIDGSNNIYVGGEVTRSVDGIWRADIFIAKFLPDTPCNVLFIDPQMTISPSPYFKSRPVVFTANNHQAGYQYNYEFNYGWGDDQFKVHATTTDAQYSYIFQDQGDGYSALGTHTIYVTIVGPSNCSKVVPFTIDVKNFEPLCEAIVPIASNNDKIKLDKFSGLYVFQRNQNCSVDIPFGCIQGQTDAPQLKNVVSASATTFSDSWKYNYMSSAPTGNTLEKGEIGKWRPLATYAYNKGNVLVDKNYNSGTFQLSHFNWQYPEVTRKSGWMKVNEVTKYTPNGEAVEEKNSLDILSAAKFGYSGALPYLIAQNAAYNSVLFESFENLYASAFEDGVAIGANTQVSTVSHSGGKSLLLGNQFTSHVFTLTKQLQDKGLLVRTWVNGSDAISNLKLKLSTQSAVKDFSLIARSGVWSLVEARIEPGAFGVAVGGTFTVSLVKQGGGNLWIDDVRMQPTDAEVSCYVYDTKTLRVLTVFDDQHFGLFYQYNAEGKLVRKQIETARGIKTVQETQYNIPEKNKTDFISE